MIQRYLILDATHRESKCSDRSVIVDIGVVDEDILRAVVTIIININSTAPILSVCSCIADRTIVPAALTTQGQL